MRAVGQNRLPGGAVMREIDLTEDGASVPSSPVDPAEASRDALQRIAERLAAAMARRIRATKTQRL